MNFTLTKDQLLIQKMVREYVEKNIEPVAAQIDRESSIPDEILQGLGELDLFGMAFPEKYGGAGAGYDNLVLALEQIAKVCPAISNLIGAHTGSGGIISLYGNEEQKKKYLPKLSTGEHIASVAWTEPGTGSDPKQIVTTARREGDEYVLNGTKRFITSPNYPGPVMVYAKETDTGNILCFIVEKWCAGYSISEAWEKLGEHGSRVHDIYLKDVRVPAENMVGTSGYPILQGMISFGKIGMCATALGNILAALEESLKYAKEKTHRGESVTKFQAMQLRIADLAINYETARWMTYRLGCIANEAAVTLGDFAKDAALTKIFVTNTAVEASKTALLVHGSYGLVTDYKVSRIYRDAAFGPGIEGVEDMQKVIVAKYVLK